MTELQRELWRELQRGLQRRFHRGLQIREGLSLEERESLIVKRELWRELRKELDEPCPVGVKLTGTKNPILPDKWRPLDIQLILLCWKNRKTNYVFNVKRKESGNFLSINHLKEI